MFELRDRAFWHGREVIIVGKTWAEKPIYDVKFEHGSVVKDVPESQLKRIDNVVSING